MKPDSLRGYSEEIRITCFGRVFWVNGSALFLSWQEQVRRSIHQAEDARGFLALLYKRIKSGTIDS